LRNSLPHVHPDDFWTPKRVCHQDSKTNFTMRPPPMRSAFRKTVASQIPKPPTYSNSINPPSNAFPDKHKTRRHTAMESHGPIDIIMHTYTVSHTHTHTHTHSRPPMPRQQMAAYIHSETDTRTSFQTNPHHLLPTINTSTPLPRPSPLSHSSLSPNPEPGPS
jgi:hypothetical protein